MIWGFEKFVGDYLRSEERPCPGEDEGYTWPPVQAVSLTLEVKLCSSVLVVENARLVMADACDD